MDYYAPTNSMPLWGWSVIGVAVGTDADGGREFVEQMRAFAGVGVEEVHVMPFTDDPVAYVRGIGDHVIGSLATA